MTERALALAREKGGSILLRRSEHPREDGFFVVDVENRLQVREALRRIAHLCVNIAHLYRPKKLARW